MKCKHLNITYSIMIFLSIFLTYIFYLSWNRPSTQMPAIGEIPLQRFSIDSCVFGEKEIYVRGWAFVEGNKNILNRIFAITNDGTAVEIMSSIEIRSDVSKAFNVKKTYDNSGFIARRRQLNSENNFTKNIILTSANIGGEFNAAKIICK